VFITGIKCVDFINQFTKDSLEALVATGAGLCDAGKHEKWHIKHRPGANSEILHFVCPPVQHRFDVSFYILGLWTNDFKTLTKNKSVRKSYYRTVFLHDH